MKETEKKKSLVLLCSRTYSGIFTESPLKYIIRIKLIAMTKYRKYLLENGTGVDLHGKDETKAAQRAVKDAISHSSMIGLGSLFKINSLKELEEALMVDVTIATPNPESIDRDAVLSVLPEGKRRINVMEGGMLWPPEEIDPVVKSHEVVMVNAVIVVLIDIEKLERT
jgi:uncharacterized protein (TIGR02058 family)